MKDKSKIPGGKARAEALPVERRKEIAKAGAAARWGEKSINATHKGSFAEDFGIDVDCYVLDDTKKTAVVSQSGMAQALGLAGRGGAFPRFISSQALAPYVGTELRDKIEKPLKFQWGSGGIEQPRSIVYGYDVTILIDVCKAIVNADDNDGLLLRQKPMARQAHTILNASAKLGIQQLVYKLAGYDATREEVITAFKLFVRDEAREYEREFPEQLYREWYRLYKIPKPPRNKPWKFMHLTNEHVYTPLAKSNGRVLELTKKKRLDADERNKRLHQFLSEIGVKALRQQLGQLLGLARISKDKDEYEGYVERLFGNQPDMFK